MPENCTVEILIVEVLRFIHQWNYICLVTCSTVWCLKLNQCLLFALCVILCEDAQTIVNNNGKQPESKISTNISCSSNCPFTLPQFYF